MASRSARSILLLGAGLLAVASLAGCRAETSPAALGLGAAEAGDLRLSEPAHDPGELGYRWVYPPFPQAYEVEPLNSPYLNGRELAEGGSYAGPWLEGREVEDLPVGRPNVLEGQAIARALGARITPALRPTLTESPYQAYIKLSAGLGEARLNGQLLTKDALWSLTYFLYRSIEPDFLEPVATRLDPAKSQSGAQIFGANCAMCHGADGWGLGHSGVGLQPPPANFHEPRRMYNRSEAKLYEVLNEGIYGSGMPPWKDVLTEQEIRSVVAFVRSFSYSTDPPGSEGAALDATQIDVEDRTSDDPVPPEGTGVEPSLPLPDDEQETP